MPSSRASAAVILVVLVLPFLLIYVIGLPQWQGRLVSVAIFQTAVVGGAIWLGLGLGGGLVRPGSFLARPEHASRRRVVERLCRMLLLGFGAMFAWTQTAPFVADLAQIASTAGPNWVTAQVWASGGLPFLKQSVRLVRDSGMELQSQTYLYYMSRIQSGRVYKLAVAPRSRLVLEARLEGGE